MSCVFEERMKRLVKAGLGRWLNQGKKGLEKESLRINEDGAIAQTPHPPALGSALTHPYITTDYSEALLELRTPPFTDVRETLKFLHELHQFVYSNLNDELLWATSMPCRLKGDSSIPIAQYGSSNVGIMKHVYRRGLAYRYGRAMQAIAGIHFNYSPPEEFWPVFQEHEQDSRPVQDFISDSYFCLIRNFQRLGWLIPYLFGATPAVCKSFLNLRIKAFPEFDLRTYFGPYATSLRMSDIGYKNKNQAGLHISYNSLEAYVATLTRATETSYPEYEPIGTKVNGEYRQLNTNILQIENEYYSFVRPKQIAQPGEKPTLALKRRGVQYVEVRALDVSAFDPLGVNENELRFLEAFLLLCLLERSPPISAEEQKEISHNQNTVACCGRDPALRLQHGGGTRAFKDWVIEICERIQGVCELLDEGETGQPYTQALKLQRKAATDVEVLPSTRMLARMQQRRESFVAFALRMSEQHKRYFKDLPLVDDRMRFFTDLAEHSLLKQKEIEAADKLSFEEYLTRYFTQS